MSGELRLDDVHAYYGTSHILFGISLVLARGECVCLLGRNGVGKSTTLKAIIGLAECRAGTIRYDGKALAGLSPYEIARLGVGYVPDDRLVFPDLTVRENLELAIKPPAPGSSIARWSVERVYGLFPALVPLDRRVAGYLSGGEQQMLTIGRTLMGNPSLLLLDEPVEGLAPVVVQEIVRQVKHLKTLGLTILFAEQNVAFAIEVADRAYVMETGQVRYGGTLAELGARPDIRQKYLMI